MTPTSTMSPRTIDVATPRPRLHSDAPRILDVRIPAELAASVGAVLSALSAA